MAVGKTANAMMELRGRMFIYYRICRGERAPDVDVIAAISLAGNLKRGDRILDEMIEKGDVIRCADGSCTLSPPAFEQAFMQDQCDLREQRELDELDESEDLE